MEYHEQRSEKLYLNYICAVAHRNSAVMTGQTPTQYTNKKLLESAEKERFRSLHYVKRMHDGPQSG